MLGSQGVLKHLQQRIHKESGRFANWWPVDPVEVGDYGLVRMSRFVRVGNLSNFGFDFETETIVSDSNVKISAREGLTGGAELGAGVSSLSIAPAKGSARLSFSERGAFVYYLIGVSTVRIKNSFRFYKDLFASVEAGQVRLNARSVIVDQVIRPKKATIMVSAGKIGSVLLNGDFSKGEEAMFSELDLGVSLASTTGSVHCFLGKGATNPLISLIHPVLASNSDAPTTFNVPTIIRRLLGGSEDDGLNIERVEPEDYR